MNYYAHAHRFLIAGKVDPYFLAGTAVPDWLSVVDRRTKCRPRQAALHTDSAERRVAALAQGIVQHHDDDRWFHSTRAFTEVSLQFAQHIQRELGDQRDLRSGFLGHILVELLLDDALISHQRAMLDDYYLMIDTVDAPLVAEHVGRIAGRPVPTLAEFIRRFVDERFLADYCDDTRLCFRLNQVLSRVGLPALPSAFACLLPLFREEIRHHKSALLSPE